MVYTHCITGSNNGSIETRVVQMCTSMDEAQALIPFVMGTYDHLEIVELPLITANTQWN
jgi:hypothetical protein